MAFNPFISFQKNKRFWMAAILMICMVSFVFCTGMKGGMEDFFSRYTRSSGPTAVIIDNRNIGRRELDELRQQRNLANAFMKNCADTAYKKAVKAFADMQKDVDETNFDKRDEKLTALLKARSTLAVRKSRPRYFEGGVKFDDLIEFKLWQLEADRLGIKIEDVYFDPLFAREFYGLLVPGEIHHAIVDAQRNGDKRDATEEYLRRAVIEEFRVKIAQYALLNAQPASFYGRRKEGELKFLRPDMPDEVRAPMTLAQAFDFFKTQQAEFSVSLVPVRVQDFLDKIENPNHIQKEDFFNKSKGDSFDPSSDKWAVEIPPRASFEFLIADPMDPRYLDLARRVNQLKLNGLRISAPVAFDVASYWLNALGNDLIALNHLKALEGHYKVEVRGDLFRTAALYSQKDCTTPILTHFAARHPHAAAGIIAGAFAAPESALAGYVAWGEYSYPLQGTEQVGKDSAKTKWLTKLAMNTAEREAALQSEADRRGPDYARFFLSGASPFPLDWMFPYLAIDPRKTMEDEIARIGRPVAMAKPLEEYKPDDYPKLKQPPRLTVETVQQEMEDMLAKQMAREWAQADILEAKKALDKAAGDPDKFTLELNKLMPKLKLTYGPEGDKKKFYDRFSVNEAKEFAKLKEAFREHVHRINLYEGRETKEKKLKEEDFPRMLFEETELSFAALTKYKAMPWPPEVQLDNTRDLSTVLNINRHVDAADLQRIQKTLIEGDPYKKPEPLQLYRTADRPILFWRTAEYTTPRPTDFKKLVAEFDGIVAERKRVEEEQKKTPKDADLQAKLNKLVKDQADKQYLIDWVTLGFKFETAREKEAFPEATRIAKSLLGVEQRNALSFMNDQTAKLPGKGEVITLTQRLLQGEEVAKNRTDYFPPTLPKDRIAFPRDVIDKENPIGKIVFPRDDMMQELLGLIDLKGPIKIETNENKDRPGVKKLDEINKDLFEQGKEQKRYVQIITNKPRSVFYVATITSPPTPIPSLFRENIQMASFEDLRGLPFGHPMARRDLLIDRGQELEAKAYRARFVAGLKVVHGVTGVDDETRKAFDGDR